MSSLIIRPILTEKFTKKAEQADKKDRRQYAFEVAIDANKPELKLAIENQFGVKVQDIRTVIQRAENVTRYTKTAIIRGKTKRRKRVIVTLVPGQSIDLYENL
jgi:large subunit ribosomal protein L23